MFRRFFFSSSLSLFTFSLSFTFHFHDVHTCARIWLQWEMGCDGTQRAMRKEQGKGAKRDGDQSSETEGLVRRNAASDEQIDGKCFLVS